MVTANDIKWGSYMNFEGPWFGGAHPYISPVNVDFMDKCLATLSATEGANYSAINMYDSCILSVGLVQWCEKFFLVSKLLGRCAELDAFMVEAMLKKYPRPVEFKKRADGQWRFYMDGNEVASESAQRKLFLGDPNIGAKGSWVGRDDLKLYAKEVAAWFANLWDYPLFRTVQAEFTKQRITLFADQASKDILFKDTSNKANESWSGALRAAYYSFAGNLPAVASKALQKAAQSPAWATADAPDKFRLALQSLTFSSGISIYPGRYERIAPVITKFFNVQIPLKAADLKTWDDAPPEHVEVILTSDEQSIVDKMNALASAVKDGICELPLPDMLMSRICCDS